MKQLSCIIRYKKNAVKKMFLLTGMLFFCCNTYAQNYQQISHRIDSLNNLGLPKSALEEVDKLEKLARQNNNSAQRIKAVIYRMNAQSAVEENALVSIIARLKQDVDEAEYPVKPVLQSLLADMYWNYYQRNRYLFNQRSHLENPGTDITKWDIKTITIETAHLYRLSLQDYKTEQEMPLTAWQDIVEGDKTTRYLRPTLYDLLLHRALNFFLAEEPALLKPKLPFTLNDPRLFGDSRTFAGLAINTTDTASTFYQGIKYLQQATRFHLQRQNSQEPLADLDLKRLEFLSRNAAIPDKGKLYFDALDKIAKQYLDKPIGADALVLQGKYYYDKDSLKLAYTYFNRVFDNALPASVGAINARDYVKMIEHKELSAIVEGVNIPNKPMLGLLTYRNVKTSRLTVYKVSTGQYNHLGKIPSDINRYMDGMTIYASDSVLNYLKKLTPVEQKDMQLPDPQDYRKHVTEFKIDAQPSGHYVFVLRDALADDPQALQVGSFKVCHLAYVTRRVANAQPEVRVVNRETGAPVAGVHVTLAGVEDQVTDAKGVCLFEPSSVYNASVKLTTATDTLYQASSYFNIEQPNRENTTTIFFTDRAIYRPGQTVYYKGLHLETANGKSVILPKQAVNLEIKDNNQKILSTAEVSTNEFGTFSGTFTIPQNILNGYVTIREGNSSKYIRVEEYKRPSFRIDFLPIKANYKLNDSVKVFGTAMAYSGYGLSNARVVYHITGQPQLKDYRVYSKYGPLLYNSSVTINDTVKANAQGNFTIKFKASEINTGIDLKDINYRYTITADITDGSGETRSANTSLLVGSNNFVVQAYVPDRVSVADSVVASAFNLNNQIQNAKVQIKIYALASPDRLFKNRLWLNQYMPTNQPDQYLLSKAEFKKDFPDYAYRGEDDEANWVVKDQIADVTLAANSKTSAVYKFDQLNKQPTGTYKIVVIAKGDQGDTSSATRFVYLMNGPGKPRKMAYWATALNNKVKPGEPANFLIGTGKAAHVLMEKYNGDLIKTSQWLDIPGGNQKMITVPVAADESNVSVQFLMISQNRMYTIYQHIINNADNQKLNIKFLTYRDKLQPGEKEQWKLQVSGQNKEQQLAEMVADLYDASLDELGGQDSWKYIANIQNNIGSHYSYYDNGFVTEITTNPLKYNNYSWSLMPRRYETLNMFGYNYYGGYNAGFLKAKQVSTVRLNGKEYAPGSGSDVTLREVMVTGYGTTMKSQLLGSVSEMAVRGGNTADKAEINYKADVAEYKAASYPVESNKVFSAVNNPITIRKNFNETAFFYPQLRTDEKGQILIEFTIPEALTKWRFKAFAHTKDLKTGYIENELVTQKQLSISANMPRFLREGDTITVSARLANLTTTGLKGKVNLRLFNALNMQPVNILTNAADAEQSFDVNASSNKPISFRIVIPAGLDALTYRLTADAGQFSDGEENTIPVLPNRMLVTESMPMMVRPGQTRLFTFDKLLNPNSTTLKNKSLTLEYTQNPAWYAVQALPYMMEFPFECSEQVFSRYYANSMASNLVSKLPAIKQVFDQWKAGNSGALLSNLEKNQELKATLIEETPWLRDALNETEQKKRIALLFDLNKMSYELQLNLDKLKDRQLPDGGFPWFGGDRSDQYITRHILAGMGQLYHLGIADTKNITLKSIADNAIAYVDHNLIDDANWEKKQKTYDGRLLSSTEVHAYYAESYYTNRAIPADIQPLLANYLQLAGTQWKFKGVYEQAMIALTMLRNNKPDVARIIIRSLLETAQRSDDMGMYWGKNQLGYFWYQSPIETQSLLIELFTEAGSNDKAVEEMKIWLLREKQTTNWKTTKATAAACYALLLKGDNLLADAGTSTIKLNGQNITDLKPNVKADAGTGYIKTTWANEQVKPAFGKVSIQNDGKTVSWGAMHWQYLEQLDKITPSKTDIHLERKYFIQKQTDAGPVLTAVDAKHQPKVGDLLKVVVYLKAGRDFEYVQLKDMRPAGTEPVDVLSTYKYQDGLYYYQVTKDVATSFFISYLAKGNYVFEYRLRVAQPGNFSTGISTVQCMYAPEFNAHSEGARMVIGQQAR